MIVLRRKSSGMTVGMIGEVEAGAIIERPDGTAMWLFYLPTRGPLASLSEERTWRPAASVEAAGAAIDAAVADWLRKTGILGEIDEQPAETAA